MTLAYISASTNIMTAGFYSLRCWGYFHFHRFKAYVDLVSSQEKINTDTEECGLCLLSISDAYLRVFAYAREES